jgi:hypothetical protein
MTKADHWRIMRMERCEKGFGYFMEHHTKNIRWELEPLFQKQTLKLPIMAHNYIIYTYEIVTCVWWNQPHGRVRTTRLEKQIIAQLSNVHSATRDASLQTFYVTNKNISLLPAFSRSTTNCIFYSQFRPLLKPWQTSKPTNWNKIQPKR